MKHIEFHQVIMELIEKHPEFKAGKVMMIKIAIMLFDDCNYFANDHER